MPLSELSALALMERLIGLAVALQALELLRIRRALADDAVFAWPILRRDFASAPRTLRFVLDRLLAERPFVLLLGIELTVAVALVLTPRPLMAPLLLVLALLVCARFRGTYNGGSDAMTMVVLLALTVARTLDGELARRVALGYVAAQLVLSYFVAGIAKLRSPAWRRGTALASIVRLPQYGVPPRVVSLLTTRPTLARFAARSVLALECAFPLALLDRRACAALLALALVFHLTNAWVLGLNRFLWAWLAAFPALWFWATRVG